MQIMIKKLQEEVQNLRARLLGGDEGAEEASLA